MSDEDVLRARARAALRAGRLPNERPERIWGGPGMGERCAVCAERIERQQAEFELQFGKASGEMPAVGTHHVHVRCFAAWEFERQNENVLPQHNQEGMIPADERDVANGAGAG